MGGTALHWQMHYKFFKVICIYMYDYNPSKHFFSNNTLAVNIIHQASPLAVGRISLSRIAHHANWSEIKQTCRSFKYLKICKQTK